MSGNITRPWLRLGSEDDVLRARGQWNPPAHAKTAPRPLKRYVVRTGLVLDPERHRDVHVHGSGLQPGPHAEADGPDVRSDIADTPASLIDRRKGERRGIIPGELPPLGVTEDGINRMEERT